METYRDEKFGLVEKIRVLEAEKAELIEKSRRRPLLTYRQKCGLALLGGIFVAVVGGTALNGNLHDVATAAVRDGGLSVALWAIFHLLATIA